MSSFVNLETVMVILVSFLVTAGIKSISDLAGADLSGYGAAITATAVAVVIGVVKTAIMPQVPVEYLPMVEQIAGMIVTILGAMGVHRTVKAMQ